ncbi:unnamed protein product [Enterobius vermicularis]|uniref:Teneurin-2 n=1 Tax=Enterobius vermicularis TaxID=51028 RepID=A0A0N4VEJ8_ENTVE|nr:unnamed protein product [Enterobius vermicularis]
MGDWLLQNGSIKKNWILVDRMSSEQTLNSSFNDSSLNSEPLAYHSSPFRLDRDPVKRISTIYKLNDRIQRRINAGYMPYSGSSRVWPLPPTVIEENDLTLSPSFSVSSKKQLTEIQNDSEQSSRSSTFSYNNKEAIEFTDCPEEVIQKAEEDFSTSAKFLDRQRISDEKQPGHGFVNEHQNYCEVNSCTGDQLFFDSNQSWTDSLMAVNEPGNFDLRKKSDHRRDEIRKRPTLLKRNSDFYKKCDVCFCNPTYSLYNSCPACHSTGANGLRSQRLKDERCDTSAIGFSSSRANNILNPATTSNNHGTDKLLKRHSTRRLSSQNEILNVEGLYPYKLYGGNTLLSAQAPDGTSPTHYLSDTSLLKTRGLGATTAPVCSERADKSLSQWSLYSPERQYKIRPALSMRATINSGSPLKERAFLDGNYNFDIYTQKRRQKDRSRRRRKILALVLCLIALALVVTAGAVLAATRA